MTQVVVPDIGDFKDVAVIEGLVKPGEAVTKEQSLVTLESDKATMEIPSPSAGVVREIKIKMGDKVSKGSPILELEAKDETARPPARPQPRAESKTAGDGSSTTVPVPDIGDFKEVEVIEVVVKPGDAVTKEQSLITLESDKATMEIPSPSQGVGRELKIKVGDKVSKGSPILVLSAGAGSAPAAAASAPSAPRAPAQAPPSRAASAPAPAPRPVPREPQEEIGAKPHASPSVRK